MTENLVEFLGSKPGVTHEQAPMYGWHILGAPDSVDGLLDDQMLVLQRMWARLRPEDLPLLLASPVKKQLIVDYSFEANCILRHAAKLWLEENQQ